MTKAHRAAGGHRLVRCVFALFRGLFFRKALGAGIKPLPKGNAAARQDAVSFEEPRFSLLLPRTHISFGEPHLSNNPSFADQCVFRVGPGEAPFSKRRPPQRSPRPPPSSPRPGGSVRRSGIAPCARPGAPRGRRGCAAPTGPSREFRAAGRCRPRRQPDRSLPRRSA